MSKRICLIGSVVGIAVSGVFIILNATNPFHLFAWGAMAIWFTYLAKVSYAI